METFRIRLNCVDHYQAIPNDKFDPLVPHTSAAKYVKTRPRVSVIRVFGATETGQKALVHVHGVFQYTYVEYTGSLAPNDVNTAIKTLQLSIDHALAVSYRRNPYDGNNEYVAHITLVKGIPFYGYHVGYKFYLKIYLLNPLHMTRLADLLRDGAVMKRALQPYESHLQYLAQWMCDYNLFGCAYVDCGKVKFRNPVPQYLDLSSDLHKWHDRSIPAELIIGNETLARQSHCSLEVDLCAKDILNRHGIESRPIHHDFIERTQPFTDTKLVQSMAGLWKDETRRRKARMGIFDDKNSPFPSEVLITMSADSRKAVTDGWIHEEEYRDKVDRIADEEQAKRTPQELSFESFVKAVPLESSIKTAFESVDDLYPENFPDLPAPISSETVSSKDDLRKGSQIVSNKPQAALVVQDYPMLKEAQTSGSVVDHTKDFITSKPVANESSDRLESSQARQMIPVAQPEFENFGIRIMGNFSHADEDNFDRSPGQCLRPVVKPPTLKPGPTRLNEDGKIRPRKRRRLVDEDNLLPDLDSLAPQDKAESLQKLEAYPLGQRSSMTREEDTSNAQRHTSYPQKLDFPLENAGAEARQTPKSSGSQNRLSFPVVKDPNHTPTTPRLSQQSSMSQKSTPISPLDEQLKDTISSTENLITSARKTSNSSPTAPTLTSQVPYLPQIQGTAVIDKHPDVVYQDAFYSKQKDVPDRQREYAGRKFKLTSNTVQNQPDYKASGTSLTPVGRKATHVRVRLTEQIQGRKRRRKRSLRIWNIAKPPPTREEVRNWLEIQPEHRGSLSPNVRHTYKHGGGFPSQIECPTQAHKYGFKYSQKQASTSVQHETQYMNIMSLEVHVSTRGTLVPNPEEDEVECIFWGLKTDDGEFEANGADGMHFGILAVANQPGIAAKISRSVAVKVEAEPTELDLLTKLVDIVRFYDPDILTGFEVHNSSWGYLIERARLKYDMNLCDELSRMKSQSHGRFGKDDDKWGFNHTSTIRITGRHTINIWRAMRSELNLLQYTMENVAYHLLHRRIPHYNFVDLTKWYRSKNPRDLARALEYFVSRVQIDLEILEANDLVPRTSEQARLLGVDWFSVISRGSQFKVESLMFRIAKPENFILASPSRRQVGGQNALECLPLVMEPQSDFYTSPLLVLDFQSLYPSVMIAYNYCYSTFLGRVVNWRGTNKMGFTDYKREEGLLALLKDHINIAPNGIMYAKPNIRKSLLAKMLGEILETRVMVKSGMKVDKEDKNLQALLNNRQLALKLIANVTYGYTSASFSGRMPCSEIADSIVQTGRETLERAIALIHSVERWRAEVVYGDTDSLFVYLKGRSREQAFDIGEEIAATITKLNPRPIKLKFEKVYHPCVLLAKKRYVGFKYEHRDQREPDFDAKGIETVRRDGTPAEQKIEETALKILFRTADLSQVKTFFQAQCAKIMKGKVSVQDFCFAKEVRLGTYSEKGPPPPGALISARRMLKDPRLEPQYGERVPYVVVAGGPGARLIDRCVAPEVLLNDPQAELDAEYYISKNLIPPLERIFNLVGANVRQWYDEMPKYKRIRRIGTGITLEGKGTGGPKKTMEAYLRSSACTICREPLKSEFPLCDACIEQAPRSLLRLRAMLTKNEFRAAQIARVCRSCSGLDWNEEIRCESKDCPVFYSRMRENAGLANTKAQVVPILKALQDRTEQLLEW